MSPIWFNSRLSQVGKEQQLIFEGEDLIRVDWIDQLKSANQNIKVLPRISIPASQEKLLHYLTTVDGRLDIFESMKPIIRNERFDGIVLDAPVLSYIDKIPLDFLTFIKELKAIMEQNRKLLFIAL